ncbi:GNAT family N-acetyltransferase [Knoellia aerolata]|uniref:N-acetyltransferase domain-containing protein n=1 Tax=Knoellia aerolata DSM 18566 TaxID=1385519 RepID=A0A0A0JRH4_9MICO|nr:GNAT family N-acetyltransferase [Knoellia aerolata]KGN40000.1 hypothetical protein N801_16925 [Knoellia aerolata DSM 18566]
MAGVEIDRAGVEIVDVPFVDERVQRLVDEVQSHYVVIYGTPDESPVDPLEFTPPGGRFVLALLDGEPVAMGGWRWRRDLAGRFEGALVGEIKRMFVSPFARGRGVARRVLAHLEDSARAEGVERLVLETGTMQPDAMGLYEAAGYERVVPFGHYARSPFVRCYGKVLR